MSHEKVSFTFILEEKKKYNFSPGETYSIILTRGTEAALFENILGEVGVKPHNILHPSSQDFGGGILNQDYRVKGQSTRKFKPEIW